MLLAACGESTPADSRREDVEFQFSDVTVESGVGFLHHKPARAEIVPLGGGIVVLDFDNDGFDDVYVTDSEGSNALYRNGGDGTFTDVAAAAGVNDAEGMGNGGCAADYDGDGQRDLYVTNYGPSKLFQNNGDGTFTDVTGPVGVGDGDKIYRSMGCAWGDYDEDGSLDLVVVRHLDEREPDLFETKNFISAVGRLALYHNNGDGTFTNTTPLLEDAPTGTGATASGDTFGNVWGAGFQPSWVDFDNDGDLDLYVVNDMGADIQPNVLWRNDGRRPDGGWSFVDASLGSGADLKMFGMGLAVGDYDLDGFLDMFMTNIKDDVLLRNDGSGLVFTDGTGRAGIDVGMIGQKLRISWGTMFFDYDNDGDEDLYMVSGFLNVKPPPANAREQPNVLLRNNGDGTFADVSGMSGADDPGTGRGGVYLDFDNDGCLDLFVSNFDQRAKLFRNACDSGNSWLAIKLVGTSSNRDGIGARVEVTAGEASQIRELSGGSGSISQNMLAAHFGLGAADRVDSVTIRWPGGRVQTLTDVAVNQRLTITEPP